ncbi:MAG TPA: transposase [Candidatus Hydrogenedentes bacterium]|nr:transposase [Candidatus Hydrogenedentota bacterium]HNT86236.1 transposase [Candidatus Hydrogenedentota bacterium]
MFLTATIIEWIPVFIGQDACDIVIDALRFCRAHKGLRLYAYVVMENHIHLVAEAPDLGQVVRDFKRHTAKELIRLAEVENKTWLLNQFSYWRKRYKRESGHQVWQEGVHPQLIQSDAMREQKIDYIHYNPVRRGWVDAPEHWRYSSARNYLLGDHSVLEVDAIDGR